MKHQSTRGKIRPKVSTMPRPQTEAAAILDLYKLAIEKERLHQELLNIDQRRQQILDRMVVLEQQVTHLEGTAKQLRQAGPQVVQQAGTTGATTGATRSPQSFHPSFTSGKSGNFDTLYLDY